MPLFSNTWRWPSIRETWPDLAAFALGLALAWTLRWQTRDLIWSLWLGSLVLGYLTILATIVGGAAVLIWSLSKSAPSDGATPRSLMAMAVGGGLFLLLFFSFHFCAFHAGHATCLAIFFPLSGITPPHILLTFLNPIRLWAFAFRYVVPHYGYFLLPAIVAERNALLKTLRAVMPRVPTSTPAFVVELFSPSDNPATNDVPDPFFAAYKNVVRLHLLIFFFAFAHLLNFDNFLVYALVYAVYFFPWHAVRQTSAPSSQEPS
jgi:hypothetical protein